jgi:hypothetical protein
MSYKDNDTIDFDGGIAELTVYRTPERKWTVAMHDPKWLFVPNIEKSFKKKRNAIKFARRLMV